MVGSGAAEETILTMIKRSDGQYSLGTDDLARLKRAGVSNRVIQAMTDKMTNVEPPSSEPAVPEPEREGVFYLFDEASNQLKPLSAETGMMRGKSKLAGFGGAKVVVDINGGGSATQIKASDHFTFLLRIPGGSNALRYLPDNADLSGMVGQLHAFVSNKGKRERTELNITYYGVWTKNKPKTGADVSATISRAAGNILKISVKALPAGEYGFNVIESSPAMPQYYTLAVVP
jgi:hypothetical protein